MIRPSQPLLPLLLAAAVACTRPEASSDDVALPAPTDLVAEQLTSTSVRLTWTDHCDNEEGYYVFISNAARPVATLPPDATTHVYEDLVMGRSYSFSVRAFGPGNAISPLARTAVMTLLSADRRNYVDDGSEKVTRPAYVEAEQTDNQHVTISWEDPVADGEGYYVYLRDTADTGYRNLEASLGKAERSYTFGDLKTGTVYVAAVQSVGTAVRHNSPIRESQPFKLTDLSKAPGFNIQEISASHAGLRVRYTLEKVTAANPEHGICLSEDHLPTVADLVFPAPQGKGGLQVLPAGVLRHGVDYRLRIYTKVGDDYYYSPTRRVSLAAAPEAITFRWTEVTGLGLPDAIKVYKTTDPLNGRNFNAWYAIADCTGDDVVFRVLNPGTEKQTIDEQAAAADGCYVLINGGIYGTKHIGPVVADGVLSDWRDEADAQYWGADGKLHYVTRSLFGVDRNGVPATCYAFYAKQGDLRFYDRPIPSVSGENLYGPATQTFPSTPLSWNPVQAITTGPLVLHNGEIPVDLDKTEGGAWLTNYELWADDIFASHPDRTCVGYTEDGKIVLFVCDGRIDASDGAYLSEVGQIMKGLGCVGALNLDGGGSTGMWAAGTHLNSLLTGSSDPLAPNATYNRPVNTTLGFFKKQQ